MPEIKRQYQPPELVRYGDLATLTKGFIDCPSGTKLDKFPGGGDDLSVQIVASPFVCVPE